MFLIQVTTMIIYPGSTPDLSAKFQINIDTNILSSKYIYREISFYTYV